MKALDGNRCAYCGSTKYLQAHHIIPKSVAPEEANNLENGITLCSWCHHYAHYNGFHRAVDYYDVIANINPDTKMGRMNAFIQEYAETNLRIAFPAGRLKTVQELAKAQGHDSVNGYINALLQGAAGLSEDEWRKKEEE